VRLLRNAEQHYPAWLAAIAGAKHFVHFENYIVHDDAAGRQFAEALIAKAKTGVPVRLIHDWLGGLGTASRHFWHTLREGGVDVRTYNPPRFDSPLGWLSRDHRKMVGVDGEVAFVTGLCVGSAWVGDPTRGIEPWRDTGVEVRGPAIADVEQSFAEIWGGLGDPLPADELPREVAKAGEVAVRVVASSPNTAGLYRLDQLIAAMARRTLWLTDAYFVGITAYVQALRAAARDGVDVRLLVPDAGDVALLRPLSRAGYRALLEAGVRVFEWNGTMLHAKTAVADGRWARVGSTNLNVSSWLGNCELDVAVEDEGFARQMEEMYVDDLQHATEIVIERRGRRRSLRGPHHPRLGSMQGSAGRAAAGALRIGRAVGAALTNRRVLGPAEARVMGTTGLVLLVTALVATLWPPLVAIPLAVVAGWLAVALLLRARRLWREGRKARKPVTAAAPAPDAGKPAA